MEIDINEESNSLKILVRAEERISQQRLLFRNIL